VLNTDRTAYRRENYSWCVQCVCVITKQWSKGAITSKTKHAIKLKTSPARRRAVIDCKLKQNANEDCNSCASFKFYCMFYFTCDRSLSGRRTLLSCAALNSQQYFHNVAWSLCLERPDVTSVTDDFCRHLKTWVFSIGVGDQSTFGERARHFFQQLCMEINKMPEFYIKIVRKIVFSNFDGTRPSPCPRLLR